MNNIKFFLLTIIVTLGLYIPAIAFAQDLDVVGTIHKSIELGKSGMWLAASVGILQILIFGLKKLSMSSGIVKQYGKVVVMILSAALAVISSVVGGINLLESLIIFGLTSGTAFIHDLLTELGVLKTAPAVVPVAPPST